MNTVFVAALWLAVEAQAPPEAALPATLIQVEGACPARQALLEALLPVLSKDALQSRREPTRVLDLGDRYDVSAAGQTTRYFDSARDCAERARVAAVFIALALSPPTLQIPVPTPTPEPPRREAPPDDVASPGPPASSGPIWAQVAVGGRLDSALGEEGAPSDLAAGGEVRGAVGRATLGVAASAAVLASTRRTFQTVSVRQQRFPFSIGVAFRHRLSPWLELGGNAGVALVLLTLRGENVTGSSSSTRLDPGVRLAIELRGPQLTEKLVAFVGLHAELLPRSYVLDVDPVGKIGVTNRLWWGATAGLSFDLAPGE